jgi:hypothetical protein
MSAGRSVDHFGEEMHVRCATPYRLLILLCTYRLLAVLVQALLNEVGAYLKLQEHWGVLVPRLVGYGSTAAGQIVFIATELIDCSPLGPGK